MKKGFVLQSLICLLAVSCSVHEMETTAPVPAEDDVFYASLESYSAPDTRVYVDVNTVVLDENEKTLFLTFWDAEDQISIFNRNTLNKKYEFMGETGDNSGYFKKVSEGTGTGASANYVCAVYPYQESTLLDDSGVLTLTLPEEQAYRENDTFGTFGPGANTMVSTTDGENNLLRFQNVGGYLVFKFYGDGVSVSSIKLEGRNGELLSGEATMTPVIGEDPAITMTQTAGTSISLTSSKAVKLGKTAKKATLFWMVVPPTEFTQGITVTVTDKEGKIFIKETDKNITIERNRVSTLAAVEVKPAEPLDPNKVIYYTTSDKSTITPAEGAVFGAGFVSTEYLDLKGVMVFDGDVTQIGDHAFEDCDRLTGMIIPATVTSIGDYAFAGCTSLGATNTPASPATMAPAKAPARSDETSLVIPDGVTSIGAYAFKDCESLTSIIIPDSVTSIGDGAFEGCTNLTDINIPDTVEDLGKNVFNGCTSITSVTIPNGVTSIDDFAFAGCSNLVSIDIPETVTSIGTHAFEDCENLIGITIPNGVTEINDYAFAACGSFTSIVIPEGVTRIGTAAFDGCYSLTDIELPSSLEFIGVGAFGGCLQLSGIVIPQQVTVIAPNAFEGCEALTSITIPENIGIIDNAAFRYCSNLNFITVQADVPPIVKADTFEDTNNCPIYVPAEYFSDYKNDATYGWNYYASRIHIIGSPDGQIQGYAYVDMGTGLKWATMNVGTTAEDQNGGLFDWSAGKTAAESWGGSWRLPTQEEFEILMDDSKYTWTWYSTSTDEGSVVEGYFVESKIQGYVGNTIFLPSTGFIDPAPESAGTFDYLGCYWSSTPGGQGYYHLEFEEGQETLLFPYVHEVALGVRPVSD